MTDTDETMMDVVMHVGGFPFTNWEAEVTRSHAMYDYIDRPTEAMTMACLECNPWVIELVRHPTDAMVRRAVELDPIVFRYVPQTTPRVRWFVSQHPRLMYLVHGQYRTRSLYRYAVRLDPRVLEYAIRDYPYDAKYLRKIRRIAYQAARSS